MSQQLTERVLACIAATQTLPPEQVTIDKSFQELGIDSMDVLEKDLKIAREFRRLDEEGMKKLVAKVKDVAGDGRHERFKSTQLFDGAYHRVQHGLTAKEVESD